MISFLTPPGRPEKPSSLSAAAINSTCVEVSWMARTMSNGPITEYQVRGQSYKHNIIIFIIITIIICSLIVFVYFHYLFSSFFTSLLQLLHQLLQTSEGPLTTAQNQVSLGADLDLYHLCLLQSGSKYNIQLRAVTEAVSHPL